VKNRSWGAPAFLQLFSAVAAALLFALTSAGATEHLGDPYGHRSLDSYTVFAFSQTDAGQKPLVDPQVMAVAPDMNIRALQKWSSKGLKAGDYNFSAVDLYHNKNITYIGGGTAAALFATEASAEAFADMATRDSLNEMVAYGGGRHNGSLANPAFRDHIFNYVKLQIDGGVDGVFLDELNGAGCQGGEKWGWNGNECLDDYFIADFNRYLLAKYPGYTAENWKKQFGMSDDNLLSSVIDPSDLENNFNYREYLAEKGFQNQPQNPDNPLAAEWGRIIANRMIPHFGGFLEEAFNRYWNDLVVRIRDYARLTQGREIFITANGITPFVDFNSIGMYNWNVDDDGAEANYVPVTNGHLDGEKSLQAHFRAMNQSGKAISNNAPTVLFIDWPTQMMTDYYSLPKSERKDFWQIYMAEAYANGLFYAMHLKTTLPDIPTAQQLDMVNFFADYAHFYRVHADYYHNVTPLDLGVNVDRQRVNTSVMAQVEHSRILLHVNNHNYDRKILVQSDLTLSLPLDKKPLEVSMVSPDFPGRKLVPFSYANGKLTVEVDSLRFYNLIEIALSPRTPPLRCNIKSLKIENSNTGAQITIDNTMSSASKGWTSCITLNKPVTIDKLWNAEKAQRLGNSVCVSNATFNGVITAGETTQFGISLQEDLAVEVLGCYAEPLTPKPSENMACEFSVKQSSATGFSAELSLTNLTERSLQGWSVKYRLKKGTQITDVSNASNTANDDRTFSLENLDWNASIDKNGTRTIGIRGAKTSENIVPDLAIIGGNCRVTPAYDYGEWTEANERVEFEFPERVANTTATFNWSDGSGGKYGMYLPAAPKDVALPVLMFLHGYTGTPISSPPWITRALNAIEPVAVFLPQRSSSEGAAAWGGTYDQNLRPSMEHALQQLQRAVENYGFDQSRVYIYGESMGAEGVFKLLAEFPNLFAGAVAVAGYTKLKGVDQMAQTPLWIIHGGADTINPTSSSQNIYQAILDAGGTKVKYTEYKGLDHVPGIRKAVHELGLADWLLDQH